MATTEQRTGFRLPWTAEPPATNDAATSDDEAVGSAAEPEAVADPIVDSTEESMIGEDTVRDTFVTNLAGRAGWDEPEVAADVDAAPAAVDADATIEVDPAPVAVGETGYAYEAEASTPTKQRTVNPLVAGLVRAMLDAAETARQEAITGLADAAKARKDQIQVESTESEAEARRVNDSDMAEIREWSKAQMARIRGETDVRITDRKHQLEAETSELGALQQRRLDHVQHVVEAYESEMDAFFQTLFAEDDPAHLAGLAQQLPEPPDFNNEDGLDDWTPESILAIAEAARSETAATLEDETPAEGEYQTETAGSVEAEASVEATDDQAGTLDLAPLDVPSASETPATAADETGDEASMTLLSVVGLVSVASIAGFKRAVAKAPGVEAISVVSGPAGDFVFTVRHEPTADIAAIVGGLEEFSAVVTNKEDGVLSVTASAPISLG
ncbi:MAG: hypothetical protein ABI573_00350 [Chloroflexota bacterium]